MIANSGSATGPDTPSTSCGRPPRATLQPTTAGLCGRPLGLLLALVLLTACGGGGGSGGGQNSGGAGNGQGGTSTPGSGSSGETADPQLAVLVQEALPADEAGLPRLARVATFGVPFGRQDQIPVDPDSGRPLLAVEGAPCFQLRTLDTWPSGTARWVLVDVLTDVPAGGQVEHTLGDGSGRSDQPDIAQLDGDWVQLDTGPLQARLARSGFDLFETVRVDGLQAVDDPADPSILGLDEAGGPLLLDPAATVTLEENGPARAVVRVDGPLRDGLGEAVLDLTLRVTARRASRALEVTVTVRNASLDRRHHVTLRSLQVGTTLLTGGDGGLATLAAPEGQPDVVAELAPGTSARCYQSFSSAPVSDVFSKAWQAPIERVWPDEGPPFFLEQGYRVVADGVVHHELGDADASPRHGFVDLTGDQVGLTLVHGQMASLWVNGLDVDGDGRVAADLWSRDAPLPTTFVWQQHESRSLLFAFHGGAAQDPGATARAFDLPLSGRAADYGHYDRSEVFPYRLLTIEQHEQALALMGIDAQVDVPNQPLTVTRFLAAGTAGGANNFPHIETLLGSEWLRHGRGGAFLRGLQLALYKSEWQVRRSDDFVDDGPALAALNDEVPHTVTTFSDQGHRYREGMILAWYLTGDPRFREALFDEAEVLKGEPFSPFERPMYRTLIALAYVSEFTGDSELRDGVLLDLLAYFTEGTGSGGALGQVDVCSDTEGAGWEGPPLPVGALQPGDRRYYAFANDLDWEKPPLQFDLFGSTQTEHFQTRGFHTASYGPTAFFHAARVLDPTNPLHATQHFNARSRLRDLSWYTLHELFPHQPDPAQRVMLYSYPICLQLTDWNATDNFHPILMGMVETFRDYRDAGLAGHGSPFLERGVEQLEGAWVRGELRDLTVRLDCQHFAALWLEQTLAP